MTYGDFLSLIETESFIHRKEKTRVHSSLSQFTLYKNAMSVSKNLIFLFGSSLKKGDMQSNFNSHNLPHWTYASEKPKLGFCCLPRSVQIKVQNRNVQRSGLLYFIYTYFSPSQTPWPFPAQLKIKLHRQNSAIKVCLTGDEKKAKRWRGCWNTRRSILWPM